MNTSLAATGWAWIYYVTFVVLAVFVVINLFIAIVINNLEAAKRDEHGHADPRTGALAASFGEIREHLEAIESALRAAHDIPGARRPESCPPGLQRRTTTPAATPCTGANVATDSVPESLRDVRS
jgi:hypothetical protein